MRLRRSLAIASVVAGAGAFAFATAPSAAATPVGVNVECASRSSQIGCTVAWRDADGRVAIRWTVNGRDFSSGDNQTSIRFDCVAGQYYAVIVTVADSTGRASDAARVQCQRG